MKIAEKQNTITHLIGAAFALSCIWAIWPASRISWQMTMSVVLFIGGMFLMFLSSSIYHWLPIGEAKKAVRKFDHISIYVMIASSYTPICIGVIGGWIGWTVFSLLWLATIGGAFYKIYCIGKYPRLSLGIYLTMGWCGVLMIKPAIEMLSTPTMICLLVEGLAYTFGTYFYAHNKHNYYHTIWHIFVLIGALAHWGAVLFILFG